MGRLLAGLQRGTGGDASVAVLCQKFSKLIERLKRAEAGEKDALEQTSLMEAKLAAQELDVEGERRHLEMATVSAREETRTLEASLRQALQEESETKQQLSAVRAETEALAQRRKALDELCLTERARLAETQGRLRHQQMSRPDAKEELRRLQGQLQTLSARSTAAATELDGLRERTSRDEIRLAKLRSELAEEEEFLERATREAAVHREDGDEALADLARLQEQMAEHQVNIQRCGSELQRYADRRLAVQDQINQRKSWLWNTHQELEGLRDTERGTERVLSESAQVWGQLRLEEEEAKQAASANTSKKTELAAIEDQLAKQAERLQQVERHRDELRSEAAIKEQEEKTLQSGVEQLRHDEAAGGGMRRNLENELQLLHAEAEKLKKECGALKAERHETHQRLQLITPTLHEARRRLREMEGHFAAAQEEASHEKVLGERLERETDSCQEKLRALRDANVRLSEQCTELDAQLLQPTPLRASSAGPPGTWCRRAPPRISLVTPRSSGKCRSSRSLGRQSATGSPRRRPASAVPRTPRMAGAAAVTGNALFETPTGSEAFWSGQRGRAAARIPVSHDAEPAFAASEPVVSRDNVWRGEQTTSGEGCPRAAEGFPPAPTLEYLRNWILNEEERLSIGSPLSVGK